MMTGHFRKTANSISVKRPRRPASGSDPLLQVRVPADVLAAVERFRGKFQGLDRSAAIRALIELGLHAGRRRNEILDPKGCRGYERKAPLAKRRRPPPAAAAPMLRIVSKEVS
jgi:hypothetical protein